nr:unnamed protein product [Digitaria exilis]
MLTSQPQAALRDLASKHGPVMYLRLGQVDTVVISSPAAAEEVLRANDLSFASRPSLLGGELCALELLCGFKVRQLAPTRDRETMSLVREVVRRCSGEGPVVVNLGELLVSCASSITGLAAFGDRCSGDLMEQFLSAISVVIFNISGFCVSDLFPSLWISGGTGTVSSTAEWVMAELMKNPDAMVKAQNEVRRAFKNIGPHDHESQMEELYYTRMVIKETLRLHPPLPLLLPRVCRETCNVGPFEVAKGSRVIINSWAIARSPEHWDDAEKFKPERFENSMADFKGTHFEYLPFGYGRRMCPGSGFGISVLELMVARLLYYFDWSLPDGMRPEELDMDMTVGASAKRTNQLHLVASPYEVLMDL